MTFLTFKDQNLRIKIQASPNAKKTEIVGIHGDALKVRVHAPPVDGTANEELCRFFAELLGVKKNAVSLKKGQTSKNKILSVTGFSLEAAQKIFERILAQPANS